MSVARCRFAARLGRPPLVGSLGLLLAGAALLLLPALAVGLLPGDNGGCLCQSPLPPGEPPTAAACLDGWLAAGPMLAITGCSAEALITGALTPQGRAGPVASVGRPPPLND